MSTTKTQNYQIVNDSAVKTLGKVARSTNEDIINSIGTELDAPLRLYASFPAADSKLNFSASKISTGDGANKSIPPLKSTMFSLDASTIDFQTQITTGATFVITWPTSTVGYFRRAGFTLLENGTIQVIFTPEASSLGSVANAGSVFATTGIPLGYIELVCTNATGKFKTAGSATNIIENASIYRFGSGSGGGGTGTGDANSFTEDLKHRLVDSFYEFVTPINFASDNDDFTASTTATYSSIDGAYVFDTSGMSLRTIQLLCTDFLTSDADVKRVEVHVEWLDSSTLDVNAVVEVSLDDNDFTQVPMVRHGTSNKLVGEVVIPTPSLAATITTGTSGSGGGTISTIQLGNASSAIQSIAKKFTITDKSQARYLYNMPIAKTGSPSGYFTVSIVKDNSNAPTGDVVYRYTDAVSNLPYLFNQTDLAAVLPPGSYWVTITTDTNYKNSYVSGSKYISIQYDNAYGSATTIGTAWVGPFRFTMTGFVYKLVSKVTTSANNKKLKSLGVFYSEVAPNPTNTPDALQKFVFSGDEDRVVFTVTNFFPHPDFLKVYDVNAGQVYRRPAFGLNGNDVFFPSGTFLSPGQTVELIFDQASGNSFDYSDKNTSLLATNHLGSTSSTTDKSVSGRGILLRAEDGTLLELWVDSNKNLQLTLPKG